ncbi:hypothetical protein BDY21DRAFT_357478, partial [Lineolata rhizophorae]
MASTRFLKGGPGGCMWKGLAIYAGVVGPALGVYFVDPGARVTSAMGGVAAAMRRGVARWVGRKRLLSARDWTRSACWNSALFLSCFSPLYQVYVWQRPSSRLKLKSVSGLALVSPVFTAYLIFAYKANPICEEVDPERSLGSTTTGFDNGRLESEDYRLSQLTHRGPKSGDHVHVL